MAFIVDPQSLSFSEIKKNLRDFITSAPDSARWSDFFASSTGVMLEDLIAGLGTFLSYNIIVGRREAYIRHAENRSSVIGIAENLGYSAGRGKNPRVKLTVIPNTTTFIQRFQSVGLVKDQNLLLENDVVFNEGMQTTIVAIIGNLYQETITINTDTAALFGFTQDNVSNDIRLSLNSNLVDHSTRIIDLFNEKFVAQSNVFGSVNVLYLNLPTFSTRYYLGDELKLEWIKLKDTTFEIKDLNFFYGTIVSAELESPYVEIESIDSIRVNAPFYNETQSLIRGRRDYEKMLLQLDSTLVDSGHIDVSPAVVRLVYVRNNSSILLSSEKTNLLNQLLQYRTMGIEPPQFKDPTIVFLPIKINVTLKKTISDPLTPINALLNKYERKLKQKIYFYDLESDIENLDFTKVARVAVRPRLWEANTIYYRGSYVVPVISTGFIYEAIRFMHRSCVVEPTWNTAVGGETWDCRLVWKTENRDLCNPDVPPHWRPNRDYQIDDVVIATYHHPVLDSLQFRVVDYLNFSGAPTFANKTTSFGTFTADNAGFDGNNIILEFDGTKSVGVVVNDWNTANPTNTVSFDGDTNYVPSAQQVRLENGSNGEPNWPAPTPPCPPPP